MIEFFLTPRDVFKKCSVCNTIWDKYADFLSDPQISLVGYQVDFVDLEEGLFLFNHECQTTLAITGGKLKGRATLAITTGKFKHLYDGPIWTERLNETDVCPEYCLRKDDLRPCPQKCECAYVRDIIQTILGWEKHSVTAADC